ncbi:hypothetical protein JX265_002175 [Neoarthrinium moseri]|uniref:Major facilitator superfamily (MFS) profile domain-containing protein n=1 Tax=Neoarthrinium moseri TaxID=1658444 RepID=A0A9Q0AUI7_9PEZI|nr:uncharacterized protein JN550_007484 [Neoarthrinium moseri]KAI1850276.1 hypothetical protein JX266_004134 [Neoarthrinium moseri]KAI1866631.1 hypothetical protein JN550_007484 [Neoarthrinium moseri]KAI1879221.1 hypothetical protein JX265_002175 [Neoarthrinium moseri]
MDRELVPAIANFNDLDSIGALPGCMNMDHHPANVLISNGWDRIRQENRNPGLSERRDRPSYQHALTPELRVLREGVSITRTAPRVPFATLAGPDGLAWSPIFFQRQPTDKAEGLGIAASILRSRTLHQAHTMSDIETGIMKNPVGLNAEEKSTSPSLGPKAGSIHDGASQFVSPQARKSLTRKLDLRMIPIIMLLYLFSFLDRVNIGNAKLYGLEEDLGLVGNQYQICVSILFVTYCLFEVPSNLIIKKVKPDRYIAFITTSWGIVATLTGVCQSYGGLIAIRLVMGALEAGLFPGLVVYLTMFYKRDQLAVRVGYLFIASAVAGVVGGMIAYGIGFLDGSHGMRAWRWLMIIEGLPSVVIGIATYFILPESLEKAHFLTEEERQQLTIIRHEEIGQTKEAEKFHWADVKEGVKDWQVWIFAFSGFTNDIMFYGFSTFLPTIIKSIGSWSAIESQALTIPVYALGTGVYLVVANYASKNQLRGVVSASFGMISIIGYCMLIANRGAAVSYAGTFVIAVGLYVSVGLPLAWLPGNKPRYAKRAFAVGMQYFIGNTAGIVMPFLYTTASAPRYYTGYGVSIAAVFCSVCIFSFLAWYYTRVNRRRAAGLEDWKFEGKTEQEILELGDYSPRYVYST